MQDLTHLFSVLVDMLARLSQFSRPKHTNRSSEARKFDLNGNCENKFEVYKKINFSFVCFVFSIFPQDESPLYHLVQLIQAHKIVSQICV